MTLRCDRMFAFLSVDETGDEGIVAYPIPGMGIAPLVGADMARMDSLRPMAEIVAKARKQPVHLVEFRTRELREIIQP